MTGRIRSLETGGASGSITAENGSRVGFDSSAVLAYDFTCLAVGQQVTFDLDSGRFPKAVNVCVQRLHRAPGADEKRHESAQVRYMGFEQKGRTRAYRFEWVVSGGGTAMLTVSADMDLFTRHHIGIQEGPSLCLDLLRVELNAAGAVVRTSHQCTLTDREMLAYLASRPAPRARRGPKRTPHAAAASHHA